ncbi:Type IV pilus biogenesis protein PilQ [hydrothermal vent metagenome]|uniref:Type IV pilus biogenesis protein PilQ n=1 Tax=hydrothermal vent metagenome TaxID=652676 RepID=A0A3B1CK39_9ZZZZ
MKTFNKRPCVAILFLLLFVSCAGGAQQAAKEPGGASEALASASITDLSVESKDQVVEVIVDSDAPLQYTAFKMSSPLRLIVDMTHTDISAFKAEMQVNKEPVDSIQPFYFDKTNDSRLEIKVSKDVHYRIDSSSPNKLRIIIAPKGFEDQLEAYVPKEDNLQQVVAEEIADETDMPKTETGLETQADGQDTESAMETMMVSDAISGPDQVKDVQFFQTATMSRVEITMSRPNTSYELLSRDEMNRLTIDLPGATISKDSEKLINVDLDESKIINVAAFQFRGGDNPLVKVVVNMEEMLLYNVRTEDDKIILDLGNDAVFALAMELSQKKEENLLEEVVGEPEKEFSGDTISMDFQRADIHNILRILSDVSQFNIITSDKVKGQVSMNLKDVPWDQALDVILKNNGLDMIQEGNIIRVATVGEIQKEKESLRKRLETQREIENLFTRIFEINYESAAKMKENLAQLKSERGSVDVNERTNSLIVQDTRQKLAEMDKLIRLLDKKERQVLIEARIVEVVHDMASELGIQWGGFYNTVTTSQFPQTIGVTGGTGVSPDSGQGGYGVNLPTGAPPTGSIGISLGHIAGTALLDARLMALQNNGMAKIVSMPKITTMNNKEANIESGQNIPYQTVSSEGTRTQWIKATLSLKVTPHITPDKHIRLEIETHKDEPLAGTPPPILTKQATTEVLVANGDTTVIGGLFKDTNSTKVNKVPGLGDIPFLGWLFKSDAKAKSGEELLIFITPTIVE